VDFVSLFAGLKVVGLAKAADSTKTAVRSDPGTSGWSLERRRFIDQPPVGPIAGG
jgi:hypothetical protein